MSLFGPCDNALEEQIRIAERPRLQSFACPHVVGQIAVVWVVQVGQCVEFQVFDYFLRRQSLLGIGGLDEEMGREKHEMEKKIQEGLEVTLVSGRVQVGCLESCARRMEWRYC